MPNHSQKTKQNIPSNWLYEENKATTLWDNLETFEAPIGHTKGSTQHNPFSQIDQSANRIRNTIAMFEIEDQQSHFLPLDKIYKTTVFSIPEWKHYTTKKIVAIK
jgi:hypothetical protein